MARAQAVPPATCGPAIAASERAVGLPPQVLGAIGLVESGRVDPRTGRAAPWPWTINVAGAGRMFDSAEAAIAAVQAAQAAGVQSIDVGCMQVNLLHHPHAFATLQDAFEPAANVRYAAGFLARLHAQDGTWAAAIAAYHSATPALGLPYARTVALVWPLAPRYGMSAPDLALPDPAAATRVALEAEIDPHDVLTPEFRTRLVDAALQSRQERTAATQHLVVGTRATSRIALENEVDPHRVLTPAFRAQMVTARAQSLAREK